MYKTIPGTARREVLESCLVSGRRFIQMNIMVTGAAGFIGSHLVDYLLGRGHDVLGTDIVPWPINLERASRNKRFKYKFVMVQDELIMPVVMKKFEPEVIYHLAAQSKVLYSYKFPQRTIDTNVNGTINILEAVRNLNLDSRVIVACSSAEYGVVSADETPIKETHPLNPIHPYGLSKMSQDILAKQYHDTYGLDTVRLRYFNQTGPRKTGDACSDFAMKIAKIELGIDRPAMIVGNLEKTRDIQYISDTVEPTTRAWAFGDPGEVYNICTGKPVVIRDALDYLLSLSTKDIEVIEKHPERLRPRDEDIMIGDGSKFCELSKWKPTTSTKEILHEMFDYWVKYYDKT
jgi:GDP-4-dehydro-6-deoxy-D-mannose reductase